MADIRYFKQEREKREKSQAITSGKSGITAWPMYIGFCWWQQP